MNIGEDMYTLLFVAFYNWELVKKANTEQEAHESNMEEIMKKHTKEKEQARELKKSLTKKDASEIFKSKFSSAIDYHLEQIDSEDEFEKAQETEAER